MPEIQIEGLGIVEIQGDRPSPAEEQAIIRALQERSSAVVSEPRMSRGVMPFLHSVGEGLVRGGVPGVGQAIGERAARLATEDRTIAQEQGIGFEAATPGERLRANLNPDEREGYERALRQRGPEWANVTVQPEPQTGRLTYTNPQTGQRHFVTGEPGRLNAGDVTSILPEAAETAIGVGGAIGGALAGPVIGAGVGAVVGGGITGALVPDQSVAGAGAIVGAAIGGAGGLPGGAIAGEALATWVARYGRLRAGQLAETVDPGLSDIELIRAAAPPALIAAGGSALATNMGLIYRIVTAGRFAPNVDPGIAERTVARARADTAVVNQPGGPPLAERGVTNQNLLDIQRSNENAPTAFAREPVGASPPLTPDGLPNADWFMGPEHRAIPLTGVNPRPQRVDITGPQGLPPGPARDLMLAQQESLRQSGTRAGDAVTARLDEQQAGVVAAEERLAARTLPGVDRNAMTPEVAGGAVRGVVREDHDRALNETLDAVDAVVGNTRRMSETGTTLRSTLEGGQDRLAELAETGYGVMNRAAEGVSGPSLPNLKEIAEERLAALRPLASLFGDDIAHLQGLIRDAGNPITYQQVNAGLSELRRRIRMLDRGQNSGDAAPLLAVMRDAEHALANDRIQMLEAAGRQDIAEQVRQLDGWYRQDSEALRRGVVERVTQTFRGSERERVGDEGVFDALTARREDAKLIADLSRDPLYAQELAPIRETMRDGFRQRFQQMAVNDENGLINPAGHRRFMRENRDLIALYFSPRDAQAFTRPGELMMDLRRRRETWRNLIGGLETDPGTGRMLVDLAPTPTEVFRHVWSANPDPTVLTHVTGALTEYARRTGDRGPLDAFRGGVMLDVREHIFRDAGSSRTGREMIEPREFSTYFRSHRAALTQVLGRDYVAGLREIQVAAERFSPGARPVAANEEGRITSAIRHLARMAVGMFTMEGRMLTAGARLEGSRAQRALARMILDPEVMIQAARMRHVTREEALALATAGGGAAGMLNE